MYWMAINGQYVTVKSIRNQKKSYDNRSFCWDRPENGQGHILFPGAVLAHAYAKARTEKQLSRGHQVALLRGFKLQHRRVPDESMQLAVGVGEGEGREGRKDEEEGRRRRRRGRRGLRCNSTMIYIHIYGSHPSLSLSHTQSCVSFSVYQQCLPLLTAQIKSNARWVRARPSLDSPNLKDVLRVTT